MKKYNGSKGYEPEILERLHKVQLQILSDFMTVCDKYNLPCFAVYGTAIGAVRHQGFIPWDDDIDMAMLRKDYNKLLKVFSKELGDKYNLLTPEIDKRYACTVTHIQKKGTIFVSEMSKDLKCEQCIFMDVFPLDYVAREKKEQQKQRIRTTFWGKLLFLAGTANPVISYEGIVGKIMSICCKMIHLLLKGFRISPRWIYRKYVKAATAHNNEKSSEFVTSFEYTGCLKDKIRVKDIFPLNKVPFESLEITVPNNNHEFLKKVYGNYMKLPPENERINHMPLIIDFGD